LIGQQIPTVVERKLRELPGPEANLVYRYLWQSGYGHKCGLFHLPFIMLVTDVKIPESQVKDALQALKERNLVVSDLMHEVFWVKDAMAANFPNGTENVNIIKGIGKHLAELAKTETYLVEKFMLINGSRYGISLPTKETIRRPGIESRVVPHVRYGEFVHMTTKQYWNLIKRHMKWARISEAAAKYFVDVEIKNLDDYMKKNVHYDPRCHAAAVGYRMAKYYAQLKRQREKGA